MMNNPWLMFAAGVLVGMFVIPRAMAMASSAGGSV